MNNLVKKCLSLECLIAVTSLAMIGLTSFYLLANYMVKSRQPDTPIYEPGTQFATFKEKLKDVNAIGYLTNKDMSEEKNDGTFLQAQYMLAPTVLELNETHPNLNILDYTSPVYTVFTMRSLRSKPIASSPYGPVLAEKQP